jgi:hypothetical protein
MTLPAGLSASLCPPLLRSVAAQGLVGSSLVEWPADPLDDVEWQSFTGLVSMHRLWSLLADATVTGNFPATDAQSEEIFSHDKEAVLTCLYLDRALVQTHEALDARGIDARIYKGVSSALAFYPEPGMRTYSDIDLMVRADQLDDLADVLAEHGATRLGPNRWSAFQLPDGWEIDPQESLRDGPFGASIPARELFATRPTLRVGGADIPTLSDAALILAACYHAILPGDLRRLVPLRDVAEMLMSDRFDEDVVREHATRWQSSIVLATAVRAAADLFHMAPTTPLLPWATAYVPSTREQRWLDAYHDPNPRGHVLKQIVYTTLAYPSRRDGARYAYGQLFHEGHGSPITRVRRLWHRVDQPGRASR